MSKKISELDPYPSFSSADQVEVLKGGGNYRMPISTIISNVPGGGTPGGSNGQIQINNAGAFGGIALGSPLQVLRVNAAGTANEYASVSGTGTVTNVATGAGLTGGPITAAGTIALAANIAPIATLGSALQVVRVNAAGTALEYAAPSGGGPAGDKVEVVYRRRSTSTAVTNTTTPTTIMAGGVADGSLTLAAGKLIQGTIIAMSGMGSLNMVTGSTLTLTITLGGVTLLTLVTAAAASTLTSRQWGVDAVEIMVQTAGASGTVRGQGRMFAAGASAGASLVSGFFSTAGLGQVSGPVTIDTTASLAFDITATWSAADPGNSIDLRAFSIRLLGGS